MPLAINTVTGLIRDYPLNIINHRRLGKNLEMYVEEEVEEDKVVIAKRVYPKKSEAKPEDTTTNEESPVTDYFKAGD
jgi:hypothetical protein